MKIFKWYIDYLDSKDKFKRKRIKFESYDLAKEWGSKNLEKFDLDTINILKEK